MVAYNDIDYVAVKHLVMYSNKMDAYKFSRTGISTSENKQSLKNMAWKYFAQDHIKRLYEIEKQRFIDNLPVMLNKLGVKNPEHEKSPKNNIQSPILPENSQISRDDLINIIGQRLSKSADDTTIKALAPLLAKLESWDKEQAQTDHNIHIYELPKTKY